MCPAFGGLRVLMRIDGAQVCMAADQGCLYGLTFVSHFYAARRSIVSPELMNAQISGGTMIDDVRCTIEKIAEDPSVRFIPVAPASPRRRVSPRSCCRSGSATLMCCLCGFRRSRFGRTPRRRMWPSRRW